MRMSALQEFILLALLEAGGHRLHRKHFLGFYATQKNTSRPSDHMQVKVITKSIERLIDRELATGYGVRTPHKWFIREVRLTRKGVTAAHKVLTKRQQKLPLRK